MIKGLLVIILVALLANMAAKWLRPAIPPKPKSPRVETARKCPRCGAYGLGDAPCGKPDCPAGRKV